MNLSRDARSARPRRYTRGGRHSSSRARYSCPCAEAAGSPSRIENHVSAAAGSGPSCACRRCKPPFGVTPPRAHLRLARRDQIEAECPRIAYPRRNLVIHGVLVPIPCMGPNKTPGGPAVGSAVSQRSGGMDQRLVVRVQNGDQRAFEALVVADQPRLYRLAYGILRDLQLAEDATQQALLDIWRDARRLRDPAKYERLVVSPARPRLLCRGQATTSLATRRRHPHPRRTARSRCLPWCRRP